MLRGNSQRTRYLYVLGAGAQTSRLIAPPIAAALMKMNIVAPIWLSLALQGICLILVNGRKIPQESSSEHKYTTVSNGGPEASQLAETTTTSTLSSPLVLPPNRSQCSTIYDKFTTLSYVMIHKLKQIAALFSTSPPRFCLVAFIVKRIAFASESFMFQYASEKFSWPL